MSVRLFLATKHSPCQMLPYSDCYTAACPGSCFVSAGWLRCPGSRPPTKTNFKVAACAKFGRSVSDMYPMARAHIPCYDATSLAAYSAAHRVQDTNTCISGCTLLVYTTYVGLLWWIVTDQKRELRSGRGDILLQQPRFKSTSGNQAFTIAVPKLWNSLSEELRMISDYTEFRKKLKTHLFRKAYQHLL